MSRVQFFSFTAAAMCIGAVAHGSSHREAPFIIGLPQVDNTDVYMFRSYEDGREDYVTIIANYIPFQDPYGGPNYYPLDDSARYEINLDNNGDAVADMRFDFHFTQTYNNQSLNVGGTLVPIPLIIAGSVGPTAPDTANLNRVDTYRIQGVRGGNRQWIMRTGSGVMGDPAVFTKPVDNIGNKTIADYEAYARDHIHEIDVPGCSTAGARVFVGQRKEGFVINVGEIFDLINLDPLGPVDSESNDLEDKNITTIALELPIDCLTAGDPVVGVWATASIREERTFDDGLTVGGSYEQVSRLGHALVNEVVIGLPDKDTFNSVPPTRDAALLTYVTNPTLPALIETLFPAAKAPTVFPRQDLVDVFLMGVAGLNRPANVVPSEMLRLNTSIAPIAAADQDPLGVLAQDTAGYPNGRRPGDDVVDISLRVAMGALLPADQAPAGQMPFTDGAYVDATQFDETFPYLLTPIPGSPDEARSAAEEDDDGPVGP